MEFTHLGYFITDWECINDWAYPMQNILVKDGKVIVKCVCKVDEGGRYHSLELLPVKRYVVDEDREKFLVENGYYGKEVFTSFEKLNERVDY